MTKKDHNNNDISMLNDKSILITGGTGSFGKAFVEKILKYGKPKRVAIFSRDELKQYDFENELVSKKLFNDSVRFFIGDVRDKERLDMALRGIDIVIHAAALKQVPTAEYNPFECINTNVIGAENIVRAAINQNVKQVIALSTDKAVNPVNLYGASKLASDKIFIAANHLSGKNGCRFSVVRYGNVIGSRGSVIPLFNNLIKQNAEYIPVTDERMTRFWITLDQGCEFVLSCINRMRSGEIFVPKIPSMRIIDIAKVIAPDLPVKIIGIRPGEKLHEIMVTADDARHCIDIEDCYVIEPSASFASTWDQGRVSFLKTGGKKVAEDFVYSSETNTEWLDEKNFKNLLK